MPRKRKYRIRGGNQSQKIATATQNLLLLNEFAKPKMPLRRLENSIPGNVGYGRKHRKMRGGAMYAIVDKYGTLIPGNY